MCFLKYGFFFLSKNGFLGNNITFSKSDDINKLWDKCDAWITDNKQIIDFIDLNSNTITDLGSGSGMPGIVIAIILKNLKKNVKIYF